ncbi:hypothetical protein K438DRAFT_1961048 [Mycena galopus ATCC 62051]|nr:hypothetical protein K438DRAFT_1961048 [Mycena galopus ATCC 62051]
MSTTPLSVRAVFLEQIEQTRQSSKADIERFIGESELKITALESQISALVDLRDRESACVASLKYILSPIRTLPVELLATIFQLTIDDDTHVNDAFRLSQVCVDWRQVAHGTLHLWTRRIQIDLENDYSEVYADAGWSRSDINRRVWEDLSSIAPRCGSLQLRGGRRLSAPKFLSRLGQCRLDILEELDLGRIGNVDGGIHLNALPRLRQLRIRIDSDFSQILIPWVQLTDLTLIVSLPDTALDILTQCANLIRASITTGGWEVLPQRRNILALPHLHALSVHFSHTPERTALFFGRISAPALRDLCVYSTMSGTGWGESHFTAFQLRAPHLTSLKFTNLVFTSDDLQAVIIHAPALTHLELRYCHRGLDDAFVGALYYRDGVTPLVPHLHSLVLGGNELEALTEDILAGMIASRWWTDTELATHVVPPAVARWTHVEVQWLGQPFFDMLKELPSDVLIRPDLE